MKCSNYSIKYLDTSNCHLDKCLVLNILLKHLFGKFIQLIMLNRLQSIFCGQSVIAILVAVSIDEVITVMQNDKGILTVEIRNALKYYGIKSTYHFIYD